MPLVALRLEPAPPLRVGDDGKVLVGDQRHALASPPRSTALRCLRPAGDIYYLRQAPHHNTKPILLLHVPIF